MILIAAVFAIGLVGGVLSGLLGIGGGIVTAPLLLYVPPLLGQAFLGMHTVSGLTITQSLCAGLFGAIMHRRFGTIDRKLAVLMSVIIFAASLAGAAASHHVSHDVLLGIFALMAAAAGVVLFLPGASESSRSEYRPGDFSGSGAAAIALAVGILGGLVGQGGSFILIPMVVSLLNVPLRVAMGSNLIIVFSASLAGFAGKFATGQVDVPLAGALLLGIVPGTWLGSSLSRRVPTAALRYAFGVLIIAACLRMVYDLMV